MDSLTIGKSSSRREGRSPSRRERRSRSPASGSASGSVSGPTVNSCVRDRAVSEPVIILDLTEETISCRDKLPTLFICGYKGTGKDTLLKQLNKVDTEGNVPCTVPFNWTILRRPDSTANLLTFEYCQRIALADALKKDCGIQYGIGPDWDDRKNVSLVGLVTDNGTELSPELLWNIQVMVGETTVRALWIYHGNTMRMYNSNHWVNEAIQTATDLGNLRTKAITDFRFENEVQHWNKKYGPTVTCRVFRKDVPIPPSDYPSEHALDKLETDLVLIPQDNFLEELRELISVFPFYEQYEMCRP